MIPATYDHGALEWRLPLPYAAVFQAATRAVELAGFRLKGADPATGAIQATAGASFLSWGERILVRVGVAPEGATVVRIDSELKLGTELFAAGRHRRNCELFMRHLAATLPPPPDAPRRPLQPPGAGMTERR